MAEQRVQRMGLDGTGTALIALVIAFVCALYVNSLTVTTVVVVLLMLTLASSFLSAPNPYSKKIRRVRIRVREADLSQSERLRLQEIETDFEEFCTDVLLDRTRGHRAVGSFRFGIEVKTTSIFD